MPAVCNLFISHKKITNRKKEHTHTFQMRTITLSFPFFYLKCYLTVSELHITYENNLVLRSSYFITCILLIHTQDARTTPYTYAKNMILFNENTNVPPLPYIGLLHHLWWKSYTNTTDKDN